MVAPHFGHATRLHGCPKACGSLSPHFGQTQVPPGPAADGPPILPRRPPPAPIPIPQPLGIMYLPVWPRRCRQGRQPGIENSGLAIFPLRYAATSSSTGPHRNAITWTPDEISQVSSGAEIAPQMRTSACILRNSPARAMKSSWLKLRDSRRTSRPFSRSMSRMLPAVSNTGEMRPWCCGIASLTPKERHSPFQIPNSLRWLENSTAPLAKCLTSRQALLQIA
jgi:hypothetical protein